MEIPVSASANYPYGTSAEKGLTRAPLSLSLLFQIPRPFQGEGERAWRARVRVIASRARGPHVACAIPRAAFEALDHDSSSRSRKMLRSPPLEAPSAIKIQCINRGKKRPVSFAVW